MTNDHRPERPGIKGPGTKDSIESWLDVLVSMLHLPPSRKDQVRDELEDHLRSRVDDLLVQGRPEHESIQRAISELGETAELARTISGASATRPSFRRFAMNAAVFILAGSCMTAGISMMMPTNAQWGAGSGAQTEAAATTETVSLAAPERVAFDLERISNLDLLNQIANAFGRDFVLSDELRKSNFVGVFGNLYLDFKGEYTIEEAVAKLDEIVGTQYYAQHFMISDTQIVLMSIDEHKRTRIVIRAYPMPDWANDSDSRRTYSIAIEDLVRTKHDMDFVTIQSINGSLVVAAQPEVQEDIVATGAELEVLAAGMRERYEARQEARKIERAKEAEAYRAERLQRVEMLREKHTLAKEALFAEWRKAEAIQTKRDRANALAVMGGKRPDGTVDDSVDHAQAVRDLDMLINEHAIEVGEAEARFDRIQAMLIDAEAELIKSDLGR